MKRSPPRLLCVLLPLVLLAVAGCETPLYMDHDDDASWTMAWAVNLDARCIAASDREIASRHNFTGATSFRVVRPTGDARAEIGGQDYVTSVPKTSFVLYSNCDPSAHATPEIVSPPSATEPWRVAVTVLDRTVRDSLRVVVSGSFSPATVRIQMKDSSNTIVVVPVINGDFSYSVVVPYSNTEKTVDAFFYTPDGAVAFRFYATLKYNAR